MTTTTLPHSPENALATRAAEAFQGYRDGRPERMGDLVDMLTTLLWNTARAQGADQQTAEDAVQTAWVRLIESGDSIKEPRAVLQWLVVTTRRETWRMVRQKRRVQGEESMPLDAVAEGPGPETLAVLTERQHVLWGHLHTLPEKCRALLRVIAFAERPDYAMIAEALGMPVGSIGPTRGRCLAKLRAALSTDTRWVG